MQPASTIPGEPFLVLAIALIHAHVSLSAVWWARSTWPLSARTIAALACCAALWLLLLILLDTASANDVTAAGWAACLAIQAAIAGLGALTIEAALDFRATAARHRFSLAFLVGMTTSVATVLGAFGTWAARHGWKVADAPGWQYFWQIQLLGVLNGGLAVLLLASVRVALSWRIRGFLVAAVFMAVPAIAPLLFHAIFAAKVGAPTVDLVWLFAAQGLFLAIALVQVEIVHAAKRCSTSLSQAVPAADSESR